MINHYWGDAERLLYLCRKYPDAGLVTGHLSEAAASIIHLVDNLYIGSNCMNHYGSAEAYVDKVGADRILFGADLSWNPVAWGWGRSYMQGFPLRLSD